MESGAFSQHNLLGELIQALFPFFLLRPVFLLYPFSPQDLCLLLRFKSISANCLHDFPLRKHIK